MEMIGWNIPIYFSVRADFIPIQMAGNKSGILCEFPERKEEEFYGDSSGKKKRKNFPNYYVPKLFQSSTIIVSFVSGFVMVLSLFAFFLPQF